MNHSLFFYFLRMHAHAANNIMSQKFHLATTYLLKLIKLQKKLLSSHSYVAAAHVQWSLKNYIKKYDVDIVAMCVLLWYMHVQFCVGLEMVEATCYWRDLYVWAYYVQVLFLPKSWPIILKIILISSSLIIPLSLWMMIISMVHMYYFS